MAEEIGGGELFTTVDFGALIDALKAAIVEESSLSDFDKKLKSTEENFKRLTSFMKLPGRRKLNDLNELDTPEELNAFIRIAYNGEHSTIDAEEGIRSLDYKLNRDKLTGFVTVKASQTKGLSFCRTMQKLVGVIKQKATRSKNKHEDVHVYAINENAKLPDGLKFVKDTPGHVCLTVTEDMRKEIVVEKLDNVSEMLTFLGTMRIEL